MYNKYNRSFTISIVIVFMLFVYSNQIAFAYPSKAIADCNIINWATWNNFTGNSATGLIKNGTEDINVTMTSNFAFSSTPTIYNYSKFNSYSTAIPNATVPQTTWSKGAGGTTTMCFSRTVTNPVLLIASLGSSSGIQAKLNFSRPYVVVFDGGNMIYHNSTSLTGIEGYAIIMFPGDFDCVTINSTTEEFYTNITWGINPPPFNASISVVDNCDKIQLTASGGVAYQWNGGDTPNSATNTFHTTGSYIVTITNASGCKTSLSKDLVIDNATSISGATTGCSEVTLTASGGISYQWDGGLNPNSATNTFLQSGQYVVKITSAKGCVSTTIIDVQVTPRASEANIQIKSTSDETICQNTPVSFIADTENAGSSPTYKWFKNGILVSSSPIYTSNDLKNNDEIKCELTSSITCIQQSTKMSNSIIMKIASPVVLSFKSPSILLDGAFVQLDPIIVGDAVSYAWSPTDGLDNPFIKNPKASPLNTTTYKLSATNSMGCEYFAEIKVLVVKGIHIPNAFSPNLDGVNDTWEIKNLDSHLGSKLMVYNRNGTIVYQAFNYAGGWDGKHKNKPLPVGVYYYTIALNDKKSTIYTGSVTIIR